MEIPRNKVHRLGSGWLKLRYASDDVLFDLHNAFKTNKFQKTANFQGSHHNVNQDICKIEGTRGGNFETGV